MCGICGSVGFDDGVEVVRRMTGAMVHRGPDTAGYLTRDLVHLGVRRLRIIDLKTGDQPIYNEDGSIGIICNGEIYNFRELIIKLEKLGHRFTSCSDTEVIIHAYEEWGKECLQYLRGMFAFAVFDGRKQSKDNRNSIRLFLARDRMGIKPLYIWRQKNRVLFASEVRAILASGKVPKNPNVSGLYSYLSFGSVQEPLTIIKGIFSLPPASWMIIEQQGDDILLQQELYWNPPTEQRNDITQEQVRSWLMDSVESHLVSDVPLGTFLSGGIDSASIVALGSQALTHPMKTFTIGFNNWPNDERHLAEKTSDRWSTEHQCRIVSQSEILSDLPKALSSMDQPSIDGINSWYVSREAKKAGLTVALSGVGGDELFAGYPSFRFVPLLKRIPHSLTLLKSIPLHQADFSWYFGRPDSLRKFWAYITGDLPVNKPYFVVRGLMTQSQIDALFLNDVRESLCEGDDDLLVWRKSIDNQYSIAQEYDPVGEVSWLEMSHYMRSTLLRDTDMMSMAHSLEVRVPFVDHLLIERVLPIAGRYKLRKSQPKSLLIDALGGDLSSEITTIQKRTFTFPFQAWLREGLYSEMEREFRGSREAIFDWINPRAVFDLWQNFLKGNTNWARPWSIYVLNAWLNNNL
jgi:asparagine synthase (glutamine-hydrolysing)